MCGIWLYYSNIIIKKSSSKFNKIKHRGPEYSTLCLINENCLLGFHRLSIQGLSPEGNQPFSYQRQNRTTVHCVCNGEIYNYERLIEKYNISVVGGSDCGVIIPLYEKLGPYLLAQKLGSEFACIIVDDNKIIAIRDPIGVRPLFYSLDNGLCLSSELKGIKGKGKVFPPGSIMIYTNDSIEFTKYTYYDTLPTFIYNEYLVMSLIKNFLIDAVEKRLSTDRNFGCLLSGGLDSSLVVSIVRYLRPNLKFPVFTIAMKGGSTDLPYAKLLAERLGLDHHIVEIDEEEALSYIPKVIDSIESWDITTIRASTMQYILMKYISEKTDVKVLLVGENSDELFMGYLYFHKAPSAEEARKDSIKLVKNVHMFDGLRTDRTAAAFGLEVRLPFAETSLINLVFSTAPELVAPRHGQEKYLLRKAFESCEIPIPKEILWRRKEAFSDAVSTIKRSWYKVIQEYVSTIDYKFNSSKSKESIYYMEIFDIFHGIRNRDVIPYYWMPCWSNTDDPSARTLNYY